MSPRATLDTAGLEAGLLLGAGRAILLQLAQPQISRAIAEHSQFTTNPRSRLLQTLGYIYAVVAGTPAQRQGMIDYVDRAHTGVHAPRNQRTGQPAYSARDPKLQLWVAATLYDSARTLGAQTVPGWDRLDAEALLAQYAVLGTALQLPAGYWPASVADFDEYFAAQLAGLQVTAAARQQAGQLFTGAAAPWWIRAVLPAMKDVSITQLPPGVRAQYGFALSRAAAARSQLLIRTAQCAGRLLPAAVRHAPARWILRRISTPEA